MYLRESSVAYITRKRWFKRCNETVIFIDNDTRYDVLVSIPNQDTIAVASYVIPIEITDEQLNQVMEDFCDIVRNFHINCTGKHTQCIHETYSGK